MEISRVLLGILIIAILFTFPAFSIQNVHAGVFPLLINDEASCESIPGAVWSTPPDTCTLTSNFTISGLGLDIAAGVTLVINSGVTLTSDSTLNNFGIIDNFGTIDQNNAVINNFGTINNYGTIDNGVSGNIVNNGIINNICDFVYSGDPIQNIPPNIIPCAPPPDNGHVIGGKIIPIETTSLLLAGTQSFSWMIPVVLSVIGIGLILVRKRV